MKISPNLYNYSSKQNAPQKQETVKTYAQNPIQQMNYAQSLAFAGWFEKFGKKPDNSDASNKTNAFDKIDNPFEMPAPNYSAKDLYNQVVELDQKIQNDSTPYEKSYHDDFLGIINHPNFDYNYKKDGKNARAILDFAPNTNWRQDGLKTKLMRELEINEIVKTGKVPQDAQEYIKKYTPIFFSDAGEDLIFDKTKTKKAFEIINKELEIDFRNPITYNPFEIPIYKKQHKYLQFLLDEGANPMKKNQGSTILNTFNIAGLSSSNEKIKEMFSLENCIRYALKSPYHGTSSFDIEDEVLIYLKYPEVKFDNFDGKGTKIEDFVKENVKDNFAKMVILSDIKTIRKTDESKTAIVNNLSNSESITIDQNTLLLLNSNEIDFDNVNNSGKTIEELINEKSENQEVKDALYNAVNILRNRSNETPLSENDKKFLELLNSKMAAAAKMLLKANDVNVNLKDSSGNPATHIAINNDDATFFRLLNTQPNILMNSFDNNGNNVGILASNKGNLNILDELIEHPHPTFNPNYINILSKTPTSMITSAKNTQTLEKVLQIPNIDINLSTSYMSAPIFYFIKKDDVNSFKLLLKQPTINAEAKDINGKSIDEAIDEITDKKLKKEFIEELRTLKDMQVLKQIRSIVDKTGTLSIESIKEYLSYPNIAKIINEPISESGERLVHYLIDLKMDEDNFNEIIDIYNKFKETNPNLDLADNYSTTPLMKAALAQNEFAVEFLLQNGADRNIKNSADETAINMTDKEEILRLFKEIPEKNSQPKKPTNGFTIGATVPAKGAGSTDADSVFKRHYGGGDVSYG